MSNAPVLPQNWILERMKNIAGRVPIILPLTYYVRKDSLELKSSCLLGLTAVGFFQRTQLLKLQRWTNRLNKEMSKHSQELPWLTEPLNGS